METKKRYKPYRVRLYLFGVFKVCGAVLNIPENSNAKEWVRQYLKTTLNASWKYRIKITEYKGLN